MASTTVTLTTAQTPLNFGASGTIHLRNVGSSELFVRVGPAFGTLAPGEEALATILGGFGSFAQVVPSGNPTGALRWETATTSTIAPILNGNLA